MCAHANALALKERAQLAAAAGTAAGGGAAAAATNKPKGSPAPSPIPARPSPSPAPSQTSQTSDGSGVSGTSGASNSNSGGPRGGGNDLSVAQWGLAGPRGFLHALPVAAETLAIFPLLPGGAVSYLANVVAAVKDLEKAAHRYRGPDATGAGVGHGGIARARAFCGGGTFALRKCSEFQPHGCGMEREVWA